MNNTAFSTRRNFGKVLLAAAGATSLGSAWGADVYPSRPIKFVVGFPPGGSTDLVTRILATQMAVELKQTVVVDNRPGAGGNVASDYVAHAPNDGYTIFLGAISTHGINPVLHKKLPFHHINDFTMITQIGYYTNLVLVNPQLPVKTLAEFIQYAKAAPRPLTFGSPGNGTSPHMTGEYFSLKTGVKLVHVPYKGSAPALTDLMGGQIDVMFDNLPSALSLVQSGKLRALAITSNQRVPQLPQVPTTAEAGVKDVVVDAWVGLMAPANLPVAITQELNRAVLASVNNPETHSKLQDKGVTVKTSTPEEFKAYIKAENLKWAEVFKASGASVD